MIEVEAVGKHEDALLGEFDIHARSSQPTFGRQPRSVRQ
jgi:hypothetical protein